MSLDDDLIVDAQEPTGIEWHKLYSCGIGYVDAYLLASARITPGARLCSRDKRPRAQAERPGVAASFS
jgi:hypothetical protein